jgi:hypothetical protein
VGAVVYILTRLEKVEDIYDCAFDWEIYATEEGCRAAYWGYMHEEVTKNKRCDNRPFEYGYQLWVRDFAEAGLLVPESPEGWTDAHVAVFNNHAQTTYEISDGEVLP